METRLSGKNKEVIISDRGPTILVGERINVSSEERLSAALREGDFQFVRMEALAQVGAGADILDVNVGIPGTDETSFLPKVVRVVTDTVDIPLCLDSNNPKALEAALKVCQGKPLMNSVTGEEHSLKQILPLVKEYGAAVIGLVIDDEGIPNDADRRVAIACKIVERAEMLGIPRHDIVIDCLVQPAGIDSRAVFVTTETLRRVKAELGVNMTIGASDSSFGLPDRNLINNAFMAIAIAAGANCAIADVARIRPIVQAADLLMGRDEFARHYIETYRQRQKR